MDILTFLVDKLWQKWYNINWGNPHYPLLIPWEFPVIFGIFLA